MGASFLVGLHLHLHIAHFAILQPTPSACSLPATLKSFRLQILHFCRRHAARLLTFTALSFRARQTPLHLQNRALLQLLCDMTAKSFSLFPPSDIEACSVANRAQVQPISGMNFNWFQLPVRCKTEPFQLQTELEDAARSKGANNQSNRTSSSTLHDQHR